MAKLKTYTFPSEIEVQVEPISPLIMQKLNAEGAPVRPRIPIERLVLKGGSIQERPNPESMDYKASMDEFALLKDEHDTAVTMRMLRFILVFAIRKPDTADYQEYVDHWQDFEPDPRELQYMYMSQQMNDGDDPNGEIGKLISFVLGQTVATEEGVQESMEVFPAGGEGGQEDNAPAQLPDGKTEEAGS
jgi:hypothetical protein